MDAYTAAYGIDLEALRDMLDLAEQKIFNLPQDVSSIQNSAMIYMESVSICELSGAGAKHEYCRARVAAIRQLYAERIERFDIDPQNP